MYIKRVETGGQELKLATLLYSENLRSDPSNHSVPVLDVIQDDEDPSVSYLVMPFLRLMSDPPFEHVEEVVDFVDQMLEVRLSVYSSDRVLINA